MGCLNTGNLLFDSSRGWKSKIEVLPDLIRRRQWHPTPVLLPGKSHGWRSLLGCSPWGHEELDVTEWLHFHFSLPCIGEGNGNPLQCSCLEDPRDGRAWWAAIYGVAQSRKRLKRLSSSSRLDSFWALWGEKFSGLSRAHRWLSSFYVSSHHCLPSLYTMHQYIKFLLLLRTSVVLD